MCVWCDNIVISPGGNRDLSQTSESCGLSQTDKGHKGLEEKIHFTHQDIGSFSISGNLLHEFIFQLHEEKAKREHWVRLYSTIDNPSTMCHTREPPCAALCAQERREDFSLGWWPIICLQLQPDARTPTGRLC